MLYATSTARRSDDGKNSTQLAPHISRPLAIRAKICPKFIDLYATIYGTQLCTTAAVPTNTRLQFILDDMKTMHSKSQCLPFENER